MSRAVRPSRPRTLAKLTGAVVVAGALVAAILLPAVGGTGLAARASASFVDALPTALTQDPFHGNTQVLAADGSLITEFYADDRAPVTSAQIAPIMKQAIVDIEDSRFYEHGGVDAQGVARALVTDVTAGGVEQGGSTLTQQLVKQTLLQSATTPAEAAAATEQTLGRKLKEARLAIALDKRSSKDDILTRYLNTVYFGEGAYGIEAAAQTYFSVEAADLTLPQASVLAGLVQSPTDDDPIADPDAAATRRNEVLQRMHDLGHISDQDLATISAEPVAVVPGTPPPRGCTAATIAPFFCDYLQGYLLDTLHLTQDQLDNGGYTIRTTLQPDLQASTDKGLLTDVRMGATLAGVLDVVQPGTGHVLAMSTNRRFGCTGPGCTSVNLNVVPAQGSGSTYKAFTAAAALQAGYGAHYALDVPQPYTSKVYENGSKPYVVSNDDAGYGAVYDMTSALVASANTYFVGLEDALGSIDGPVDTAVAMGMHFDAPNQRSADFLKQNQVGSFTLGFNATSPLDLADAYATIAAQGTQCDPTPVTAILDASGQPAQNADGTPVYAGDACHPGAISPGVANTLDQMLLGVVSNAGTGRQAIIPGHQVAGKTGTTQENQSASFVGSTPDYTVSVMYFDPLGKVYVGGVGGGVPAKVFHDAMAPVLRQQPAKPFPPADPAVEAGTKGRGYQPPPPPAPSPSATGHATPSAPAPGTPAPGAPTTAPAPGATGGDQATPGNGANDGNGGTGSGGTDGGGTDGGGTDDGGTDGGGAAGPTG